MKEILEWLQKPNYAAGVKLYEKVGDSPSKLHQFRTGRPQKMHAYLVTEMRRLAHVGKFTTNSPVKFRRPAQLTAPVRPAKPTASASEVIGTKPYSEEYTRVEQYRREKYVEMARLRNALTDMATDEERVKAMAKIEELFELNKKLWREMDHYDRHGQWLEGFPLAETKEARPAESSNPDVLRAERGRLLKRLKRAEDRLGILQTKEGVESSKYKKKEREFIEMRSDLEQLENKLKKS